mgnify:CR=1 FL=1
MKITQMYSITDAVEFLFYNKNLKFVDNCPLCHAPQDLHQVENFLSVEKFISLQNW